MFIYKYIYIQLTKTQYIKPKITHVYQSGEAQSGWLKTTKLYFSLMLHVHHEVTTAFSTQSSYGIQANRKTSFWNILLL